MVEGLSLKEGMRVVGGRVGRWKEWGYWGCRCRCRWQKREAAHVVDVGDVKD